MNTRNELKLSNKIYRVAMRKLKLTPVEADGLACAIMGAVRGQADLVDQLLSVRKKDFVRSIRAKHQEMLRARDKALYDRAHALAEAEFPDHDPDDLASSIVSHVRGQDEAARSAMEQDARAMLDGLSEEDRGKIFEGLYGEYTEEGAKEANDILARSFMGVFTKGL